MVFGVVLVEVSQKSRKMLIFWKKSFLTTAKIWDTSTKVQSPPPKYLPGKVQNFDPTSWIHHEKSSLPMFISGSDLNGSYRPKGGWPKSISGQIFGAEGAKFFWKMAHFLAKTAFLHSFAEPNLMQKIIEKLLKIC